mmetsp:Transcript_16873/g.54778  ORF Transcript_16873/g.54778 Transcript_16873/m.54778 type:complete len:281 (+) Transcript_16873:103-945(+)
MAAEHGLSPTAISEHLGLPRIPEKDEPHSLELLIRLKTRRGCRQSDTRAVVATMVVPHDASCCSMLDWMHELDDSLESYCYLNVQHQGLKMLGVSSHGVRRDPSDCGATEQEAALPHSLCVRVWAIQAADYDVGYGSGYDSGGGEEMHQDAAGFRKCEVLGSREALMRKAMARLRADEDLFDGESPYRAEEGNAPPKHIDVKFHCAIADVLPLPEDVRPTMQEYAANTMRYGCSFGWTAEMEWNHSENEYEASAVRRLPRLRDEQYPVITKIRSVPHAYL